MCQNDLPPQMSFNGNGWNHFVFTVRRKWKASLRRFSLKGEIFMPVTYTDGYIDSFFTTQELGEVVDDHLLHGPSKTGRYGGKIEFWDVCFGTVRHPFTNFREVRKLYINNRTKMLAGEQRYIFQKRYHRMGEQTYQSDSLLLLLLLLLLLE